MSWNFEEGCESASVLKFDMFNLVSLSIRDIQFVLLILCIKNYCGKPVF